MDSINFNAMTNLPEILKYEETAYHDWDKGEKFPYTQRYRVLGWCGMNGVETEVSFKIKVLAKERAEHGAGTMIYWEDLMVLSEKQWEKIAIRHGNGRPVVDERGECPFPYPPPKVKGKGAYVFTFDSVDEMWFSSEICPVDLEPEPYATTTLGALAKARLQEDDGWIAVVTEKSVVYYRLG